MSGHGEKLSRKKEKAIAALLSQPSIPMAAKEAGIGESTLWRWLQLEDFNSEYRKARREVVTHAITKLQKGMSDAVQTLQEVMMDNEAPASARVSAAKTMLDMGIKGMETEDLEERISKLEKIIEEKHIEKS